MSCGRKELGGPARGMQNCWEGVRCHFPGALQGPSSAPFPPEHKVAQQEGSMPGRLRTVVLSTQGSLPAQPPEVCPPDPLKPSLGLVGRPDGVGGGQHGLGDQDTPRPWGCRSDAQ